MSTIDNEEIINTIQSMNREEEGRLIFSTQKIILTKQHIETAVKTTWELSLRYFPCTKLVAKYAGFDELYKALGNFETNCNKEVIEEGAMQDFISLPPVDIVNALCKNEIDVQEVTKQETQTSEGEQEHTKGVKNMTEKKKIRRPKKQNVSAKNPNLPSAEEMEMECKDKYLIDFAKGVVDKSGVIAVQRAGHDVHTIRTGKAGSEGYQQRQYALISERDKLFRQMKPCTYMLTVTAGTVFDGLSLEESMEQFTRTFKYKMKLYAAKKNALFQYCIEVTKHGRPHAHAVLYFKEWLSPADEEKQDCETASKDSYNTLKSLFDDIGIFDLEVAKTTKLMAYTAKNKLQTIEAVLADAKVNDGKITDEQKQFLLLYYIAASIRVRIYNASHILKSQMKDTEKTEEQPREKQYIISDEECFEKMEQFCDGRIDEEEVMPYYLNIIGKYMKCLTVRVAAIKKPNGTIALLKQKYAEGKHINMNDLKKCAPITELGCNGCEFRNMYARIQYAIENNIKLQKFKKYLPKYEKDLIVCTN